MTKDSLRSAVPSRWKKTLEGDPLFEEAIKLLNDQDLRSHVSRTLPNKWKNFEEISARGLARFARDFDIISDELTGTAKIKT